MAAVISAMAFVAANALPLLAAATTANTGYNMVQGNQASQKQKGELDKQNRAQADALAMQKQQAAASQEAVNRANQKMPDVGAIMSAAQQAARSGVSSTMLTGPTGIDPTSMQLGKKTLLGA